MKRPIIPTCLILLTLCAFAQAEFADFKDDFDGEPSPLWEPVLGVWEPKDGAYNGQGAGPVIPGFSLLPFEAADGLVIEVRAMDTGNRHRKNALIVFAYVDESEIYQAGSHLLNQRWAITRTAHAGRSNRDLAFKSEAVGSKRWYHMRVEIDRTTIRLRVDGTLKVKYTFDPELPKGRIGLGVDGGDTLFDEVSVRRVDAFPVDSKGLLATTWAQLKSGHN